MKKLRAPQDGPAPNRPDRKAAETLSYVIPTLAVVCLATSAFYATAAFCLRNFARSRLEAVCRTRGNPRRFGVILKGDEHAQRTSEILSAGLLIVGLALVVARHPFPAPVVDWWTPAIELAGLAIVLVLATVVFPYAISRVYGEQFLYRSWPLLSLSNRALRPVLAVADGIDTVVHRIAGRQDPKPDTTETLSEEIQSVVNEGEREGVFERRSRRMIQRVIDLGEEDVTAVMTPRTDVVFVPIQATIQEARTLILDSGHSRIPAIGESHDDVVGILFARDLLEHLGNSTSDSALTLKEIVHEPFFIPETTSIDQLLERMKRERFHLAMVLDEYGGVAGLVTLEDILEEIVGDIEDEFDEAADEQVQRIDDVTTDVDARMHLDDLNELFHYDLPEEGDFDTIGGFVFSEMGRIPKQGETLEWRNLRITVLEADKRKVIKLRIQIDYSLVPAGDDEG